MRLSLHDCCRARDEDLFAALGEALPCRHGRLTFADHGSSVLAVCHLDTVGLPNHYFESRRRVYSPALDDRLGLWILTQLLPEKGVLVDWLFTDNEEHGASTARDFEPPRPYHWIMSFDRAGTDVVLYQYEDPELLALLQPCGLRPGRGSYSDICDLEHLACKGFNFGAGYHLQHSPGCFADLRETQKQVERCCAFFQAHQGTRFEHEPVEYDDYWYGDWPLYEDEAEIVYVDPEHGPITLAEVYDLEGELFWGMEPPRLTPRQRAIYDYCLRDETAH